MRRKWFPTSIRWRLPLSYAGIALLAAVALGAVLLPTLRGFYAQQELKYLQENARAVGKVIAQMLDSNAAESAIQSQMDTFSFLSRVRVHLLDTDRQVVAESGIFEDGEIVSFNLPLPPDEDILTTYAPGMRVVIEGAPPPGDGEQASWFFIRRGQKIDKDVFAETRDVFLGDVLPSDIEPVTGDIRVTAMQATEAIPVKRLAIVG